MLQVRIYYLTITYSHNANLGILCASATPLARSTQVQSPWKSIYLLSNYITRVTRSGLTTQFGEQLGLNLAEACSQNRSLATTMGGQHPYHSSALSCLRSPHWRSWQRFCQQAWFRRWPRSVHSWFLGTRTWWVGDLTLSTPLSSKLR